MKDLLSIKWQKQEIPFTEKVLPLSLVDDEALQLPGEQQQVVEQEEEEVAAADGQAHSHLQQITFQHQQTGNSQNLYSLIEKQSRFQHEVSNSQDFNMKWVTVKISAWRE